MDSSPSETKTKTDQIPEKDDRNKTKNDNENNCGIKHISGNLNSEDLYALPNKKKNQDGKIDEITASEEDGENEEKGKKEDIEGIEDKDANKDLPPGWEKHEGEDYLIKMSWILFIYLYFILF